MIFNASRIKGEIQKNRLYLVKTDGITEFAFQEKQGDTLHIQYLLKEKQYGLYGEEYRPEFLNQSGHKVVDIFGMIVDESKENYASFIIDLKETVGGEDGIFHLIEQWKATFSYEQVLTQIDMQNFHTEKHFMVATREFEEERIQNVVQSRTSELESELQADKKLPVNNRVKRNTSRLKLEAELKILRSFANGMVEIMGTEYPYEVLHLKQSGGAYECKQVLEL